MKLRQAVSALVTVLCGNGWLMNRDEVLSFMKTIDPDGVSMRKAHRLKRRKYKANGPNYVWHVNLKPNGFCIHGSIDGYSRRILW